MSAPRRARGPYSPLICTRCRARKIKCFLPLSVTAPSTISQPTDQACRRCRENGFDCIVNQTVLGRPGSSSRYSGGSGIRLGLSDNVDEDDTQARSADTRQFLLSRPEDEEGGGKKIGAAEVCEAMSSPLRFLSVLLSHQPSFGRDLNQKEAWNGPISLGKVISAATQDSLEPILAWHRIHYPYIPTLHALRSRLPISAGGHATIALYALMCILAVDSSPKPQPVSNAGIKTLHTAVYHYGQAALIHPPTHRDTVTFFQLLAEYRPLALVDSPIAAIASLTDSSYLSLARKAAIEIGLDQSWSTIDDPNSDAEDGILETLQWLHLSMTYDYSSFILGKSDMRHEPLARFRPIIETLEKILERNAMPRPALYMTVHLLIAVKSTQARHRMVLCWRDLGGLGAIIHRHESESTKLRCLLVTSLRSLPDPRMECSDVIEMLINAESHKHRLLVRQSAMFFAVMAASHFREQATFDPSEVTQIGDRVIDHLKLPRQLNQVHAFMAEFGADTADELEKQLTDSITLFADCRLDGLSYSPPIKTVASEVLHTAYLLVQQNAARLKGWGGLHERVDTNIIVLGECANKLEHLASQEGEKGHTGAGICKSTAILVRDLQGILTDWKQRMSQTPQCSVVDSSAAGSSTIRSTALNHVSDHISTESHMVTSSDLPLPSAPGAWATEMFATWDMWPQPQGIEFSQFIDFDFEPTIQDDA